MKKSQFKLSIYEYTDDRRYSFKSLTNSHIGVLYRDWLYLRAICNGESTVLYKFDKVDQWFKLVEDGIWVSKRGIDKIDKIVFVDIFNIGVQKSDKELVFAEQLVQIDNYNIGWKVNENYDSTYYSTHKESGKLFESHKYFDKFYWDEKLLFGYRVRENDLTCLDLKFAEKWSISFNESTILFLDSTKIAFTDELIVVNVGTVLGKVDFKLTAFNKRTGNKVWSKLFKNAPYQCLTIDNRVYITVDKQMVVLDADTGDILVDEYMDFVDLETEQAPEISIGLFPDGKFLLAYSQTHAAIRIYSLDGRTLQQEILLPAPKSEHNFGEISPISATIPSKCNGKIYIQLSHITGLGAIGILEQTKGEPSVYIEERLPFVLEQTPAKIGHSYKLSIEHDNFHNLVSCSRYELMEIGQYYGKHRSEHNHYDARLNDQILLSVKNNSTFPSDAKALLEEMTKDVEEFLETFITSSPLTGKPFKISVELV